MKKKLVGLALVFILAFSFSLVALGGGDGGGGGAYPPGCAEGPTSIILYPTPYCPYDELIEP